MSRSGEPPGVGERDAAGRAPVGRTRPWHWVLAGVGTGGSVLGPVAVNIVSDEVSRRLGHYVGVFVVVAFLAATPLAVRGIRGRLANQRARSGAPGRRARAGEVTELPAGAATTGREAEVEWLVHTLTAERVAVLFGRPGVGTSSCALEAAGRLAGTGRARPHYLDLRAGRRPLRPGRVLGAVSGTLAGPGLLVLDNVSDAAQVRPLLRHLAGCRLLVAGGPGLDELGAVSRRRLTEPSRRDAVELFRSAVRGIAMGGAPARGRGPDRDRTVEALVELCGRQPAALRALGERMAVRGWSAADLLAMLRARLARGTWHRGEPNPALSLLLASDRAYTALSHQGRRLYRLLALAPQPLSRDEVAVLGGVSRRRADRLLAELSAGSFVDSAPDDRYRVRPLLSGYARLHLQLTEPLAGRRAAVGRLVAHLSSSAQRYAAMLPGPVGTVGTVPTRPDTDPDAWFVRREASLRALVRRAWGSPGGLPPQPSQRLRRRWVHLAVALCAWYSARGRLHDWAGACQAVLATPAARRPAVAGWAYNDLGVVRRRQGQPQAAANELNQAVALRPRHGAAQSRTNLGLALLDLGDVEGAVDQLQRAARQRSGRDRGGQALTDLALGAAFLAAGDPRYARRHLVAAANRFSALGDPRGYAAALANLTLAQWRLGERLDAMHAWRRALERCEGLDAPEITAVVLLNAGATMLASGRTDPRRARQYLAQSLRLGAGGPGARGRALLHLGDAAEVLRGPVPARHRWLAAARVCEQAGDRAGYEAALARLDP